MNKFLTGGVFSLCVYFFFMLKQLKQSKQSGIRQNEQKELSSKLMQFIFHAYSM